VYIGPWANAFGGIDASFASAAIVSAVVYVALLLISPESRDGYSATASTTAAAPPPRV